MKINKKNSTLLAIILISPIFLSSCSKKGELDKKSSNSDKVIVGDTIYNEYGVVQVEVKLKASMITSIKILAKPLGVSKDYSDYALPILIEESIKIQSAKVNSVSGASYTSESYKKSLASALAKN